MNPGYLSYVIITCFIILLSSGWRIELVGHLNRWKVMVFVGLWLVLMPLSWNVTSTITFHISSILIVALLMIVGIHFNSRIQLVQFLLFCLMVAFWHGYMLYSQRWSPIYVIHPVLDVAIGEALIVGLIVKNPIHQITIISSGVLVGVLLEQLWSDLLHIQIGHAIAWDHIFVALFFTRGVALIVQWSRSKMISS